MIETTEGPAIGARLSTPIVMAAPEGRCYAPKCRWKKRLVSAEEMFAAGALKAAWSGAVPQPTLAAYQVRRGPRGRAVRRHLRRWRAHNSGVPSFRSAA